MARDLQGVQNQANKSVIKDRKGKSKTDNTDNLLRTCSTVKSAKKESDDKIGGDIKWKCPICEEVISSKSKPAATQKIAGHMVRLHYQKWREGIGSQQVVSQAQKWIQFGCDP